VNVEVVEYDMSTPEFRNDKRLFVLINGYEFVTHDRNFPLAVVPREPVASSVVTPTGTTIPAGPQRNDMDAPGMYDIHFSHSGAHFNIYSPTLKGTLKGLIDVRDGNNTLATMYIDNTVFPPTSANIPTAGIPAGGVPAATTNYKGIPFYMNKLNDLVRTFARAFNEGLDEMGEQIPGVIGHLNGYDAYGNRGGLLFTYSRFGTTDVGTGNPGNPSVSGSGDFEWIPNPKGGPPAMIIDYSKLNALNFTVNPKMLAGDGYRLLACTDDPTKGIDHNNVILGFQKISTYQSLFREGRLLDFIVATSSHMSIDRRQAKNFQFNYNEIVMQTDNQRMSVSGVDINEEMMDLVKYQNLYMAGAKLINVINNIYDIMINRLGAF
jgi:flagellar hook-associated protein 1 FlgK